MKIPEVRSHVVYSRNETVTAGDPRTVDLSSGALPRGSAMKTKRVSHDAIVTGYERAADHNPETDGPPMINLAFAEPGQEACFAGVTWASGFSRAFSVPHESVDDSGHHFYSAPDYEKTISDMNKGIAILRQQLADTTEGRDAALQAVADLNAKSPQIETKNYSDGSSATGVAPLPDQSPDQQNAAEADAAKTGGPTAPGPFLVSIDVQDSLG